LSESATVTGDKEDLIATVLTGVPPTAAENDTDYPQPMPAFDFLSNGEIALILTHIRSHLGNSVSGVSAGEVERVRSGRPGFE